MTYGVGQVSTSSVPTQTTAPPVTTTGSSGGHSVAVGNGGGVSATQSNHVAANHGGVNVLSRYIQAGSANGATALASVRTPGIGERVADQEAQLTRKLAALNNMIDNLDHGSQGYVSSKASMLMLEHVHELLSVAPAGKEEAEDQIADLDKACATLDVALNKMDLAGRSNAAVKTLHAPLKALADALRDNVDLQKQQLDAGIMSNPLSEKACFACKANWAEGAVAMLDREAKALDAAGETDRSAILKNAKAKIADHIADLQNRTGLDPLSKDERDEIMGAKRSGPIHAILEKISPAAYGKIAKELSFDKNLKEEATAFAGRFDFSGDNDLTLPESQAQISEESMLAAVLTRAFEQAGIPADRVEHDLNEARKALLNAQPWTTVAANVELQHGKTTYSLTSTIQPQSQIAGQFQDLNGGGVNCHMTMAYAHGTNVAVSSAEIGGRTIFSGIRHGIISPYDISPKKLAVLNVSELAKMVDDLLLKKPDGQAATYLPLGNDANAIAARMKSDKGFALLVADSMRAEGSYRRGLDVATTALVSDPAKLQRALKGETVAIALNSISLVTPGSGEGGKEKKMLEDQVGAWNRLASDPQPKTVIVKNAQGQNVPVKISVDVRAFNFGVNKVAFEEIAGTGGVKSVASRAANKMMNLDGLEASDRYNTIAMDGLIGTPEARAANGGFGGAVKQWLDASTDAHAKAQVEELARQVGQIWDSGAHRTPGAEPYKIVSRLALLSDLIGETPCWNCKSGKDRTGNLDNEVKFLAAQLHTTGTVPTPDRARTDEEKANFFRIGRFGGNHEMQLRNTGVPGYKYDGLSALTEQMGGKKALETLKGLSKYIGS